MNVNVEALNKAMKLSGNRTIAPQHYAQASGKEWYAARSELREYARCGFLEATKAGTFRVLEFSVDD